MYELVTARNIRGSHAQCVEHCGMASTYQQHSGILYALQFTYAVPDDAWCIELSEAVPAPSEWRNIPGAVKHLPGSAFLIAIVPDEDLTREPVIHIHDTGRDVPYAVMTWFMTQVADEIRRVREPLLEKAHALDSDEDPER
jgi:hypothetical protein